MTKYNMLLTKPKDRSLDSLVKSQLYRKKQNPHKYYIPNGKSEIFINKVGSNKTFITLFSAANGVGKTAVGVNIVAHILYGLSGNPYFNLPLFERFPYPKRGRIISDSTTIQQTIVPELKKWLPKDRWDTSKEGKNYEYHWITDTGFSFDLMTYEQETSEFESATLGWAWFDEPPPLAIFKATVARMRKGGVIFITATPLTGSAWMYDHIISYNGKDSDQRDFVEADVEDNCKQHGVRGILEHNDIERMIKEYDEEDKQARVHGKFQHLIGLVFKKFNRKIHVIKPCRLSRRDYTFYRALDPHTRNPDAYLVIAVDRNGTKIVCDELYGNFTTSELIHRLSIKEERYQCEAGWIDPSAFVEDKHKDNPIQETLGAKLINAGLHFFKGSKDRKGADRRIKDALDFEMVGEEIIVAPEFYIFNTCTRTIWEFEHYQWDDWRGRIAERKDPRESPIDKDDHMIENVGRILIQEPVYTDPVVYNRRNNSIKKDFEVY